MIQQLINAITNDRRKDIDPTDGIDTTTERLIPGDSAIERVDWHIGEITTGIGVGCIARLGSIAYQFSPIVHLHVLIWCGLAGYCVYLTLQRLNALPGAKTWSIYSFFVVLLSAILSIGFWIVVGV